MDVDGLLLDIDGVLTVSWEPIDGAIDTLDPEVYPHVHALRRTLTTTASPDQFEYGLRHLVDSLRPTNPT